MWMSHSRGWERPTADISLGNVSLSGVGSTFTVAAADGITINTGTIATTGTQTYNSPVTTAGIATLESSGGTLDFQSTLAVNADLTLRAPTISFGAAVTPTGSPTITLEPFDASANLNVASLGTGQAFRMGLGPSSLAAPMVRAPSTSAPLVSKIRSRFVLQQRGDRREWCPHGYR
jgi:hypothetical protein